jgi:hypothetical protein
MLAGETSNNKQKNSYSKPIVIQKRNSRTVLEVATLWGATDLAVDLQSNDSNAGLSDQYARQMMAMLVEKE